MNDSVLKRSSLVQCFSFNMRTITFWLWRENELQFKMYTIGRWRKKGENYFKNIRSHNDTTKNVILTFKQWSHQRLTCVFRVDWRWRQERKKNQWHNWTNTEKSPQPHFDCMSTAVPTRVQSYNNAPGTRITVKIVDSWLFCYFLPCLGYILIMV